MNVHCTSMLCCCYVLFDDKLDVTGDSVPYGCYVRQQVAVVERQIFDFFGFMWTCIIVNFVQIIVVIAGLFGVCQDRAKIVIVVSTFTLIVS